jgi:hypothetical protein
VSFLDVCNGLCAEGAILTSDFSDLKPSGEKFMTKLGKLYMAVVLALALAPSALAGITETPPAAPPPPGPSITASGTIETPPSAVTAPVASTDPVVDIALALWQSALLMF